MPSSDPEDLAKGGILTHEPLSPMRGAEPLVLLASAQEWLSRAIESVLTPAGYVVQLTFTDVATLRRVEADPPDVVILDVGLPDAGGLEVCRRLRGAGLVTASTPILVTTSEPTSRSARLEALRAGACELWGQPLDSEEYVLRLGAHVRAKLDADEARRQGLVDPQTGFYNSAGLLRRAEEVGADARRRASAAAVVALAPALVGPDAEIALRDAVHVLTDVLQRQGRHSDIIARIGAEEFAVLAPNTDEAGATLLFNRLTKEFERAWAGSGHPGRPMTLRQGHASVPNWKTVAGLSPKELLGRASARLHARPA